MSSCHTAHETRCGRKYAAFNRASCPLSITHRLAFQEDDVSFGSIEQYLAFKKAAHAGMPALYQKVLRTREPDVARNLVRCIPPSTQWDEIETMKQGLLLKFTQNPSGRNHLCATRNAVLVSTYAVGGLWGVRKIKEYDAEITDASKWQGENRLGDLLVELRQHFLAEKERQQKEHELKRSDSFHDLTIDAELGRFCEQIHLQGEDRADVEMPFDFLEYDDLVFGHETDDCIFCDISASFEF